MLDAFVDNPKHWRARAEDSRRHAEQLTDRESKWTMLEIAEGYETLARRAEQRLRAAINSK